MTAYFTYADICITRSQWVKHIDELYIAATPMFHNGDVIVGAIASQITSPVIIYSFYSGADQRKYQSSESLAFVRRIHRRPVNSPHKWPVTRKMFPFDDVIMQSLSRNKRRADKPLPEPMTTETIDICVTIYCGISM